MRRESCRPGMLIAAGVLLLIVGGWTLLNVFCAGGAMVFQNALDPVVGGGGDALAFGVDPDVAKEVPSAVFVEGGVLFIRVFLGIAMLLAGIGVLQMKPVARVLGIVVGAADVLVTMIHSLHNALLVFPVQGRILAEEAGDFPPGPFDFIEAIQGAMWGSLVFQVVFTLLWWGVVIFFLCHPSVRAACDSGGQPEEPRRSYPRRDDYDDPDDDYGAVPRKPPSDTGVTDRPW
ncbi:MAG: hypothetical protein EXR98_10645 [Gemmataceae bacterium]|nr:hypothetical protein [Gemmataceae bacterium]